MHRRRMRGLIVVVAACAGCADTWTGWEDVPTATLTPQAAAPLEAEWSAFVVDQAAVWSTALAASGCMSPFTIGDGGHIIALVPAADWSYGDDVAGMTTDRIEVREAKTGGVRRSAMLLHELGHALGLDHADPSFGASVMIAKPGSELAARDVAAAACRLGCGPCDRGVDPYSIAP